jgi:hypothetical protein
MGGVVQQDDLVLRRSFARREKAWLNDISFELI